MSTDNLQSEIQILLLTANDTEFFTAFHSLKRISKTRDFVFNNNRYVIGKINQYYIALLKQSDIGGLRTGGTFNTLSEALTVFPKCKYVFSIGCCASAKKNRAMGDVTLADETIGYDSAKLIEENSETTIIDRSERIRAGRIGQLSKTYLSQLKHRNYKIGHGVFLSGEKLFDGNKPKNDLIKQFPEANCIDMESFAIASVCYHSHIEWLVIKGFSDRAKNKRGDKNQEKATQHCFNVLRDLLARVPLHLERPRVFISGSSDFSDKELAESEDFIYTLATVLLTRGYKIINGYGKNVGGPLMAAAYRFHTNIFSSCQDTLTDLIEIFPFPRIVSPLVIKYLDAIKTINRKEMENNCPFTIIIYGQKVGEKNPVSGIQEEYAIAKGNKSFIIPVGFTGFSASYYYKLELNDLLKNTKSISKSLINDFESLGITPKSKEEAANTIVRIIDDYYEKSIIEM